MQRVAGGLSSIGSTLSRNVTVPLVALGAVSGKMSVDFQAAMERVHTQAGASQMQVKKLSDAVLNMAGTVGVGPKTLADGMYHVVSSLNATTPPAQRLSKELAVLKVAAEGARVGGADLVDVTNALDAAVVSGMKGTHNFNQAMGALNATVGAGDMTMQDLADALGTGILGPMRTFGVSLTDVSAALAVFGDNNIRGQDAATKLTSAIRIMAAPSNQAAKVLSGIGLSATQLADDIRTKGLVAAFEDLKKHLEDSGKTASQQARILTEAFGGRQSTGVQLLLSQLDRLKAKYAEVNKGANTFTSAVAANNKTFSQQLAQLAATAEAIAVRIGDALLPVVIPALKQIGSVVSGVAADFEKLPAGLRTVLIDVAIGLAAAGPALKLLGLLTRGISGFIGIARSVGNLALGRSFMQVGEDAQAGAVQASRATASIATAARDMSVAVRESAAQISTALADMAAASRVSAGEMDAAFASEASGANIAAVRIDAAAARMRRASVGTGLATPTAAVAPAGRAAAPAVESVAINEASLASRIRGVASTALAGATRGLLIGGIGTLLSQTVGSAIHGGVGSAVKAIGTDASIGAGFGAIFGPPGIAGGALIGGLVGSVMHFVKNDAQAEGDEFAKRFTSTMGVRLTDAVKRAQANTANAVKNVVQTRETTRDVLTPGSKLGPSLPVNFRSQQEQQLTSEALIAGRRFGQQFVAGWQQVKTPTATLFMADIHKALNEVPVQVRQQGAVAVDAWRMSAAKQMLTYATTLEQNKKLPMGALQGIVHSLEAQVPGLTQNLVLEGGVKTAQGLAHAFRFTQASANLRQALQSYKSQFGDWQVSANITDQKIWQNAAVAMGHLHDVVRTTTGQTKQDALANLTTLKNRATSLLDDLAHNASDKMAQAAAGIARGSRQAESLATGAFNGLASNVGQAMHAGLLKVNTGVQLIAKALNQQLVAFGAKPLPIASAIQWANWASGNTPAPQASGGIGHRATGGMLVDHPMYMVGEEAPTHPEYVVPTNPAHRPRALGLFHQLGRAIKVPGFAQGGTPGFDNSYVYPFPSGTTLGRIDEGIDAGMPVGAPIGAIGPARVAKILPNWSAGQPIVTEVLTSGPAAGRAVYLAEQITNIAPVGSRLTGHDALARFAASGTDIEMGWGNAATGVPLAAPHYSEGDRTAEGVSFASFIAGLTHGVIQGLIGGVGGGAAGLAAVFNNIKAPAIKGAGAVGAIVNAAMAKLTDAANKKGQSIAASLGGGAAGSVPLTGNAGNVMAEVGRILLSKGFNKIGAAGILGNAYGESGWNPASVGSGGGGLWGFTAGDISLASLQAYAAQHGVPWTNAALQTQFLLYGPQPAIRLRAGLNAQSSPAAASDYFMNNWEHPGIPRSSVREAGAQRAFAAGFAKGGIPGLAEDALMHHLGGGGAIGHDGAFTPMLGFKKGGIPPNRKPTSVTQEKRSQHGPKLGGLFGGDTKKPRGTLGASGPFPFQEGDLAPIGDLITKIFALDGGSGGLGVGPDGDTTRLSDLIQFNTNLWSDDTLFPAPNFSSAGSPADFLITQDANGNPIPPVLSTHLHDVYDKLRKVTDWQFGWVGDLKQTVALTQLIRKPLEHAIKRRVAEIKRIHARIAANVKKIHALKKKIDAENKRHAPFRHPKGKAQHDANRKFEKDRKNRITGHGGYDDQIKKLEAENLKLGGSKDSVGNKRELGTIKAELGTPAAGSPLAIAEGGGSSSSGLYGLQDSVGGWISQITGTGGDLDQQQMQLRIYQSQVNHLLPDAQTSLKNAKLAFKASTTTGTPDTGTGTGSIDTSTADQTKISGLQAELAASSLRARSAEALLRADVPIPGLAQGGMLPFAGWYGTGGDFVATAPTLVGVGDGGAERVSVRPVNDRSGDGVVHLHFANGMEWLGSFITATIESRERGQVRTAIRRLPGAGGGSVVVRR